MSYAYTGRRRKSLHDRICDSIKFWNKKANSTTNVYPVDNAIAFKSDGYRETITIADKFSFPKDWICLLPRMWVENSNYKDLITERPIPSDVSDEVMNSLPSDFFLVRVPKKGVENKNGWDYFAVPHIAVYFYQNFTKK